MVLSFVNHPPILPPVERKQLPGPEEPLPAYPARRLTFAEQWSWYLAEHCWLIDYEERQTAPGRYSQREGTEIRRIMAEADAGAIPETRWACTAPDAEIGECGAGLRWHESACPNGHRVRWD